MTRRRVLLLGSVAVVVAVLAFVVVQAFRPVTTLPKDRIEKLKTGMSRAEALEIIGKPPGDYTTRPFNATLPKFDEAHQVVWRTDEAILMLNFRIDGDELGQVVTMMPLPESLWQRVGRWFGL